MEQEKNLFVFGPSGSGKSYLLNILLGFDPDNDETLPFEIGQSCESQTKNIICKSGTLYGKKTNLKIKLLDLPGLFDSSDPNYQNQNVKPKSIQFLEDLEKNIKEAFNESINRVLFCLDANRRWDYQQIFSLKLLRKFVPEKNICFIITKCNQLRKKEKEVKLASWKKVFEQEKIEEIFFFGQNCDSVDENFYHNVQKSQRCNIKYWKDLSITDKQQIGNFFNYIVPDEIQRGCFSLDMLMSLINGEELQCGQIANKLLMSDGLQSNQFLGYVHFDQHSQMNFIQFVTIDNKVLECTDNHLIYCEKKYHGKEVNSYIQAKDIEVGDYLLLIKLDHNKNLIRIPSRIAEKKIIIKTGFWCPLTSNGCLIVNHFLVSSYTSNTRYVNQQLAHLSMLPLIKYREMFGYSIQFENGQFLSPYTLTSIKKRFINQK